MVAMDVSTLEEAERLLARLGASVRIVKIGLELFAAAGPSVVHLARSHGKTVFLDLKLLDIGETVRRATKRVIDAGVEFLTVHADRQALRAAVEAKLDAGSAVKILAVTVLTNIGPSELREAGVQLSVPELVVARARLAAEVGCDGVVASGEEPRLIRGAVGKELVIVTPGIRPADHDRHDHARVSTPAAAIAAGADYLVVGRPIRDAGDPLAAAESILAEMQRAFDARGSSEVMR